MGELLKVPDTPLLHSVFGKVEDGFSALGMNTPFSRFLGGTVAATVALNILKPRFAYSGDQARPWALFDTSDAIHEPTYLPWYVASILMGVALAVFI